MLGQSYVLTLSAAQAVEIDFISRAKELSPDELRDLVFEFLWRSSSGDLRWICTEIQLLLPRSPLSASKLVYMLTACSL